MKILSTIILKKTIATLVSAVMAIAPLSAQMATSISNTQKTATSYSTTVNSNNLSNFKLNLFGKTVKDYTANSLSNSKDNPRMFNKKSVPTLEVKGYEAPAYTAPDFSVEYSDPEAAAEEETQANEPVATWDVSATENDDVTMAYYDSDDVESILDQFTAAIANIFLPMTAYAAEVTVIKDDVAAVGDDLDDPTPSYEGGTVVVYGDGEMQPGVYNNFLRIEKYAAAGAEALSEYYGVEIQGVYDENITDVFDVDSSIDWIVTQGNDEYPTGSEVYIEEEIRNAIDAKDFLDYSPKAIVFVGNVTNISDNAFKFCADITEVILPDTIEEIGADAFAYCTGLETLVLNEGLEVIECGAFYQCRSLMTVTIPASVTYVGLYAFDALPTGSTIYCQTQQLNNYFNNNQNMIFGQGTTLVFNQ